VQFQFSQQDSRAYVARTARQHADQAGDRNRRSVSLRHRGLDQLHLRRRGRNALVVGACPPFGMWRGLDGRTPFARPSVSTCRSSEYAFATYVRPECAGAGRCVAAGAPPIQQFAQACCHRKGEIRSRPLGEAQKYGSDACAKRPTEIAGCPG
jgi:hypothetical protein